MFQDITNTVEEKDGAVYVKTTFKVLSMFGYNGIDSRDRQLVRDKIMDFTGAYDLSCKDGSKTLATTEVWIRPYDSFNTQSESDKKIAELAARANAAGLYAKVEQIGETAGEKPINAIFIAAKDSDLTSYQQLAERAETEPAQVQKEIKDGTLEYKVPVMYSNVHADEAPGTDGCLAFIEAIVEAAEGNGAIPYTKIVSLTEKGKATVAEEMKEDGKVWSELIKDKVTGVGYIQGNGTFEPTSNIGEGVSQYSRSSDATVDLSDEEMAEYYNMEQRELNLKEILDNIFFIIVPSENADGRTVFTRTNDNYFDLNRDNTYQTQSKTRAMTHLIASWNPVSFHEIHGFYEQFQVEPCSPTHEPNAEYDLFMDTALEQGENFGATAIANNEKINSFQTPMRDYLSIDEDGNKEWTPFDDMSTSYTPQYSFLHGVNGFTVEVPYGSEEAVQAVKYGFIGNAAFVKENKDRMFTNQLEIYRRGIENIDADTIRPWYVSQSDEIGADADVFRKKYKENNNFFPEYYIIPMNSAAQKNTKAAQEMVEYLLRNDVKLDKLTKDVTVNGVTYKKGSVVINMHQAKRNMANAAMYDNVVITDWGDLYSEPLTAFPLLRGFDSAVITTKDAISSTSLTPLTETPDVSTVVSGSGKCVVISNNGLDAVNAVNDILADGGNVAMITDGADKGDFLVTKSVFESVKNEYVLSAKYVEKVPEARLIDKNIEIYVPGRAASAFKNYKGHPYGLANYVDRLTNSLGWDLFALEKQLGFTLTDDAEKADIIVGNRSLSKSEVELVKNGKAYVGYTANAIKSAKAAGMDVDYVNGNGYDALTTVTYESDSLITAVYERQNDNVMYGYGGNYFTKVPEGAEVLIKTTSDYPIEGFISKSHIEKYKNTIQAIDYNKDGLDVTLFANTLTNKAHQQDDYRYLSNAIYEKMLTGTSEDVENIIGTEAAANLKAPAKATAALTTKFSKTSGYDDVKFSWSKAANASGYEVYYKKASAKSYTPLTSTANTYAYKKDLADGTKYFFKVVPYVSVNGTKYYASSYKTASVYTLKRVETPTVTASGSKVKVKWVNINGESGYQISRSTKKTGTNIVSTYPTTTGTYKLISATKGKTYYYKVRAYKTVNGVKIYGPWSYAKEYKRK